MTKITTHVLDTGRGKPAVGLVVGLYRFEAGRWEEIASGVTNVDGRIVDWVRGDSEGMYDGAVDSGKSDSGDGNREQLCRIRFETGAYFSGLGIAAFHPFVEVHFTVGNDGHYHIPLLLSPFGYTTYRGS